MKLSTVLLAFLLVSLLPGCNSLPEDLMQLKDDKSTICVVTVTPWGTQTVVRTNQTGTFIKGCNDITQGQSH